MALGDARRFRARGRLNAAPSPAAALGPASGLGMLGAFEAGRDNCCIPAAALACRRTAKCSSLTSCQRL